MTEVYQWAYGQTIEGIQLTNDNKDQVFNWAASHQQNIWHTWENGKPCIVIPTHNGPVRCTIGDYIIIIPSDDWQRIYAIKETVFEILFKKFDGLKPDMKALKEISEQIKNRSVSPAEARYNDIQ